jgi:hypothetical protein
LIAAGGDVDGTFRPQTGDGGNGGRISGSGGNSGNIGNNGDGGKGGLIKETSDSGDLKGIGTVEQEASEICFVAAGGVVAPVLFFPLTNLHIYAPSQARTGNGGRAVDGNGGSSGDIGTNGNGGKGGTVDLSTGSGDIISPRGGIVTAGGDGGTSFNQTGNGGSTDVGIGGSSGDIGRNSNGGSAGPISLVSTFGNVDVGGVLILRGAIASNSGDRTGDGGTAKLAGKGGDSGSIGSIGAFGLLFAGGSAGDGGKLTISAGSSVTTSEAIISTGGDAGALSPLAPPGLPAGQTGLYRPITGNGGNGGTKGGDAGNIGLAGFAGKGGEVVVKTAAPTSPSPVPPGSLNIDVDRIVVDGGTAGHAPSEFEGVVYPAGDGVQRGQGGNGGAGAAGGNGGTVAGGVIGGGAGKITVSSAGNIRSVEFSANGGNGGDQKGIGGQGGTGTGNGKAGNGGNVNQAGNAGDAGTITLLAEEGISITHLVVATGGNGGSNEGKAGNGGDGLVNAGGGGELGNSGDGGKGGTLVVKTPPVVTPLSEGQVIDIESNKELDFDGGNAGRMTGSAGNGGNGLGKPGRDSAGGNGGNSLDAGAGGQGGSITLQSPGGLVRLLSDGASVNGGDDGSYSAKSGDGGKSTGAKPGGRGGDSGRQGDAGGGIPFNPLVMTITIETGTFTLPAKAILSANGGNALSYQNTPGNGGDGGGRGGDGGAGGHAGSGGLGGTVKITTSNQLVIKGLISANGGERTPIAVTSGNGGDAGSFVGSGGGDGGMIAGAGSAGGGGTISLKSSDSDVISHEDTDTDAGSGTLIANGGDYGFVDSQANAAPIMAGGNGGLGGRYAKGGNGGSTGSGPGTGAGGSISVDGATGITVPFYQANAGAFFGVFNAVGGKGGDDPANGIGYGGGGGNGGAVESAGMGGDGGTVILNSAGAITIDTISANGSSMGAMAASGGKGGSQLKGDGEGGQGGTVANNGSGGKGGTIKLTAQKCRFPFNTL